MTDPYANLPTTLNVVVGLHPGSSFVNSPTHPTTLDLGCGVVLVGTAETFTRLADACDLAAGAILEATDFRDAGIDPHCIAHAEPFGLCTCPEPRADDGSAAVAVTLSGAVDGL
jgi:hypothetical protein